MKQESKGVLIASAIILALIAVMSHERSFGADLALPKPKPNQVAGVCPVQTPLPPSELKADPYACFGSGRYTAMASGCTCTPAAEPAPPKELLTYSCAFVRVYMQSHTEAEARAAAKAYRLPEWMIKKAEACLR